MSFQELMKEQTLAGGYCDSLTHYQRMKTREVTVGGLILGGGKPIWIQSMTTTDTMDTNATVEQSIRMIEAGCELVRITAPSMHEANNLANIRAELKKRGYKVPLIADIHFTPNAAEAAARIVEKVRVNPGNYADKKKFESLDYSDATYNSELERIAERFVPLVRICKEYGTAMRIGTNHGSLSDRIMSRYGDTPLGMVESALEFLRICEMEGYFNIVLSMKASNPQIMVQAYRLLISKMQAEGMNYPLHLGVTEAGEGEDGRIKSATGIGTLLEDGIGDTIRVSLTEDPEFEIPVAKALVARYTERKELSEPIPVLDQVGPFNAENKTELTYSPFEYTRRKSSKILNTGGHEVPRVIADLSHLPKITESTLFANGYTYDAKSDKWTILDQACDFIYSGRIIPSFQIPGTLGIISDASVWDKKKERHYPLFLFNEFLKSDHRSEILNFVLIDVDTLFDKSGSKLSSLPSNVVLVLETSNEHGMAEQRRVFIELNRAGINFPVIIRRNYSESEADELSLYASTDLGALLLDGFGDGVWITAPNITARGKVNSTAFGVLQATRTRISKTEYISCPSCGRTLFDLQETTAKIRSRTDHLKGVKIGIMGCIVNGPGEMADADYGYVGTGVGKITLYKGKEVVKRNINSEEAVEALIDLIKAGGDWVEKGILVP